MLLKLSEHTGKASRETAAAIFQEMLHVGIGKLPLLQCGGGAENVSMTSTTCVCHRAKFNNIVASAAGIHLQ